MAKITEEEFKDITELRSKLATIVSDAGQISLQIQLLEENLVELKEKSLELTKTFKTLLDDEQKLVNRLSETYGPGSVNFETGEFTPDR